MGLAGTVTVEGDLHSKTVFKAHRLDGEGLFLLLGAATHLGLDAEAHLDGKIAFRHRWTLLTLQFSALLIVSLIPEYLSLYLYVIYQLYTPI